MNWLGHIFGLDNGSGPWYLGWSGAGSDIGEIAILGFIWQAYRKHNCGVKGCWRIGIRKVEGTDHVVCHVHHPLPKPSHQDVLNDHEAARGRIAP